MENKIQKTLITTPLVAVFLNNRGATEIINIKRKYFNVTCGMMNTHQSSKSSAGFLFTLTIENNSDDKDSNKAAQKYISLVEKYNADVKKIIIPAMSKLEMSHVKNNDKGQKTNQYNVISNDILKKVSASNNFTDEEKKFLRQPQVFFSVSTAFNEANQRYVISCLNREDKSYTPLPKFEKTVVNNMYINNSRIIVKQKLGELVKNEKNYNKYYVLFFPRRDDINLKFKALLYSTYDIEPSEKIRDVSSLKMFVTKHSKYASKGSNEYKKLLQKIKNNFNEFVFNSKEEESSNPKHVEISFFTEHKSDLGSIEIKKMNEDNISDFFPTEYVKKTNVDLFGDVNDGINPNSNSDGNFA